LLRTAKANEENYLLYLKKQEEARIADALDQSNILNVVVGQAPTVPALPSRSPWLFGLIGIVLASVASVSAAFTLDYLDQSFRTPAEVIAELGIPVLAAVPRHAHVRNGNGSRSNRQPFNEEQVIHRVQVR
jgi:capsular polysaccharide biosynthesis protein